MGQQIHTLFHQLDHSKIYTDFIGEARSAAVYVVGGDVVEIMQREDVFKSIQALMEADVFRLPYPKMLVEFSAHENVRRFCLIKEMPGEKYAMTAECVFLHCGDSKEMTTHHTTTNGEVRMTKEMFMAGEFGTKQDAHSAILAISMSLLFLNTKGIEKVHVEPSAFNRARIKKGKSVAVPYTYMRIGTVFDREGRAVKVVGGGKVRMHMRAGHTKNQHYGPSNSLTKIIYIGPVLVNYNPHEEVVIKPRKVSV
jgi:hypothetical protein